MKVTTEQLLQEIEYVRQHLLAGNISNQDIRVLGEVLINSKQHNVHIPDRVLNEIIELQDIFKRNGVDPEFERKFHKNIIAQIPELRHKTIDQFSEGITEEVVRPDDNVVFLLGAGASYDSGIPLVSGLLEKLVEQARRTQSEEFNQLMKSCENSDDIGIEDLLTAVYLAEFAVSESSTLSLLQYFLFSDGNGMTSTNHSDNGESDTEVDLLSSEQIGTDPTSVNFIQDAIQTLFASIASEMIPDSSNDTHTEIRHFINNHDNTSIITTNYDYCMEKELFGEMDLNTTLNIVDGTSDDDDAVELYKMHGSITWTYCDTCQSVDGVPPEKVEERFDTGGGTLGFPVKGICPVCRGERRPLLVPPTSFKFVQFPPLIDIRAGAKKRLQEADYIIPVGYSFSDDDAYIYKLVWGAMRRNDDAKMLVVDPNARDLSADLQTKFGVQSSDFDTDRVKPVHGNSEEVMGELVDALLPDESDDQGESTGPDNSREETTA